MMHSVPKTLHGATLGKAHQWVRSITDTREYALENPDGERISLADLTNGSTKQVRVVGEVKKNPAHPAAFTGRSFGMNQHVNLTHILPEEVKPALVSSMVREQGLFGAVQSLSILLARPLKDFTPTSPMAEEILRSMFYDYKGGAVPLRNPAPVGFGRSYGGRILGEEIAARDAALMKYVEEAVKKTDSIDLTEGELDNFLKNSFVPYMLAAEANRRAISYIRRFILPAAKEFNVRGTALQREFDYMVKHMATDPAHFYHGKEFAIIAHPAFLFPQFGPVVLPVPVGDPKKKKEDEATKYATDVIDDLFVNAGNPPRFDKGTFVRRESDYKRDDKYLVEFLGDYLVGGSKVGGVMDWQYVKDRMKKFDIGVIVRAFGTKITTGDRMAYASDESEFIEAFKKLKDKDTKEILEKASEQQSAALFVMDLHGMKPRPTDWPDALVLSAMEVFSKNRAGMSGKMTLVEKLETDAKFDFMEPITVEVSEGGHTASIEVDFTKLDELQGKLNAEWAPFIGMAPPQASNVIMEALKIATPKGMLITDANLSTSSISIGELMAEAVSLAVTKHGYEADEDDIRFVTALIIKAAQEMDTLSYVAEIKGPARAFAEVVKAASEEATTEATDAIAAFSARGEDAGTYLGLLALKEAIEKMEVV